VNGRRFAIARALRPPSCEPWKLRPVPGTYRGLETVVALLVLRSRRVYVANLSKCEVTAAFWR